MNKPKNGRTTTSFRINDDLRGDYDVRIVGNDIESKVVKLSEAKRIAAEMEKDVIEINKGINPPIMRIDNYDKFLYHLKKTSKPQKQKPMKEIQLSATISQHDLETKEKNASKFITEGHKVKVILSLKGRENVRREENKKPLLQFIVALDDIAVPEGQIKDNGNRSIVILKKRI